MHLWIDIIRKLWKGKVVPPTALWRICYSSDPKDNIPDQQLLEFGKEMRGCFVQEIQTHFAIPEKVLESFPPEVQVAKICPELFILRLEITWYRHLRLRAPRFA